MRSVLEMTDEEVLAEAHKLREGYKMKRVLRYKTKRDQSVHSESDAEHVFGLIYLAHYFLKTEPACANLNAEKVYTTLLFHDFPEIKYGDVHTYEKTSEQEDREKLAAQEVFQSLPDAIRDIGYEHWKEYESLASPEAKFCYALDKIEPLFELLDKVNERTLHVLKTTYEMHITNKAKASKDFPVLHRFNMVVSGDMQKRGAFWQEKETNTV